MGRKKENELKKAYGYRTIEESVSKVCHVY